MDGQTGIQKIFNKMNASRLFIKLQLRSQDSEIYAERPRGARYQVKINSYGCYSLLLDQSTVLNSFNYDDLINHIDELSNQLK